jgi:adenylate kinase
MERSNTVVCYLTGAPATGKSTLSRAVEKVCKNVKIFSYSKELRNYVNSRLPSLSLTEDSVRAQSAAVITKADVDAVDNQLIEFIKSNRQNYSIIVDSHAVTKERFGFRVTTFNPEQLLALNPDKIVSLYAHPKIISDRIRKESLGRPLPDLDDIQLHIHAQNSVAIQYGFVLGKACYLLDSNQAANDLLSQFLDLTGVS